MPLAKHPAFPALALCLASVAPAQTVLTVDRELGMDDGEITPDGRYGVVRMNSEGAELRVYEMATGALLHQHDCNVTSQFPQMENEDGVALTNERTVVIGHCAVIGDLTAVGTPEFHMASYPVGKAARDVEITPDGSIAAVRGGRTNSYVQVIDLRAKAVTLGADVVPPVTNTYYPWCDGVVANDTHALAFGYDQCFQCGWAAVVDLFDQPLNYCAGGANSVGSVAGIFASGSASIAANDFLLWSAELPPNKLGAVIYGDGQQQLPFGSGNACVGGTIHRFPIQPIQADGVFVQAVDSSGPAKLGGAIAAGGTWNFQLLYRDGGTTNTTGGLSVTFTP